MGKTGKWLRSILTGKKDNNKEKERSYQHNDNVDQSQIKHSTLGNETNPTTPISIPTPKEKRRWSFRRSSAAASAPPKDCSPASAAAAEPAIGAATTPPPASLAQAALDAQSEQHKKHAMAVAAATAAAADAAVAAAQAAAAVIRLTAVANGSKTTAAEEAAAVKIQSVFRSYLARKALCALKGLVKLQALVRGHLVRKQATATLRCMQALVTAQARARAQRIRAADDAKPAATANHWTSTHRKSVQDNWLRNPFHDIDMGNLEENIKIVEMDIAATKGSATKSRNSYSLYPPPPPERTDHRLSTHHSAARPPSARASHDNNNHHNNHRIGNCQVSPAPSAAVTDMSPRACSGHFEDYSFGTAQSSPQCYSAASKPDPAQIPFAFPRPDYSESLSYEFPLCPNYMANTESSRAKARSQSAPKSRPPDAFERQPSTRRRASIEGRNVPRAMRMQRSSSHVGAAAQNYQYPWSIKLDRSTVSLRDSECGSTSTVLTNTNYCRSLVGFDIHGNRY